MSVACNLPKSVLFNIKQLIVSASYKETFGRQNQSIKCATFCTPERCQSMFKAFYFGADCWTDHRLVVSKLNLRIQPARRPQGKKAPKKVQVGKDQEKAQSEKDSHSKNRGGKKPN